MRTRSYARALRPSRQFLSVCRSLRGQAPDTQGNREVVRRHLDLMNRGEWRQAAEYFAEDVQHHRGNWQTARKASSRGIAVLSLRSSPSVRGLCLLEERFRAHCSIESA